MGRDGTVGTGDRGRDKRAKSHTFSTSVESGGLKIIINNNTFTPPEPNMYY